MKKCFGIAVATTLLIVGGALFSARSLAGEPDAGGDSAGPADLGSISVTAPPQVEAGLAVERVGRKTIDEEEATSAAELLDRLPSVQMFSNARGEQLIQLRGFDQQQLLVLIDGVPAALPFDGVLDLGKLPPAMIERIEVIKGAGSVIYGPGGLGGAINIITRSPRHSPRLAFTVEGSPVHEIGASLVHGGKIAKFDYAVFGGFDDRKNFPLSDDYTPQANQGKGDRVGSGRTYGYGGGKIEVALTDRQRLALSGNVVGGWYGVPPSTGSARPKYWRYDPWLAASAQLAHEGRYAGDALEISEALFVSPNNNVLRSYDDGNYTTQTKRSSFISTYDDLAAGGSLRAKLALHPGGIRGLDLRLWGGGRYETHRESTAGTPGETQYSHWLLTIAPQVDAKLSDAWTVTAGAQIDAEVPDRFDGVVSPHNQITAGPLVAVAWQPTKRVDVALSGARRARFPTLKERFADAFGQRVPNPNLGAETAWNFSLDATAHLPAGFTGYLSGFDSEVSGLIVQVPVAAGVVQLQNAGRARLAGFEARIDWEEKDWGLSATGGYQFLWAHRLDAAYPSSQLDNRPMHKALANIRWEFLKGYAFINEAVITGPRPVLDTDSGAWVRLGTSADWNVRVEGNVTKWMQLWLAATNIVDLNNAGGYGYPDAGRQVWAGLKIVDAK